MIARCYGIASEKAKEYGILLRPIVLVALFLFYLLIKAPSTQQENVNQDSSVVGSMSKQQAVQSASDPQNVDTLRGQVLKAAVCGNSAFIRILMLDIIEHARGKIAPEIVSSYLGTDGEKFISSALAYVQVTLLQLGEDASIGEFNKYYNAIRESMVSSLMNEVLKDDASLQKE